ncbi:TetR/AcrR family transcriptional regulator [Lactobacillus corticis]|uniref:TetR family transcriptional regulator n=1 Tax=Lactobacillus corticis TaxID=2201249 RepID=A0A916QIM6_9LACO|nr:TetR/AcrR family transcriptional regulator [Lactobacillus corticis]GFZ27714.1 TetR family transcriptional regulator [Lactobacillus corticis]
MARRKNMKRRRVILSNTFRLIRENGFDNVSLQRIAEESGISKSLLQSYYPHKATLINDIVHQVFTTLSECVEIKYPDEPKNPYALSKAFVYLIVKLGVTDDGLDQIIMQAFMNNKTLDNWGTMLNTWISKKRLFDEENIDFNELSVGIPFVAAGAGRLYYDRAKHHVDPEKLADYAVKSLMFSFLKCTATDIKQAVNEGHRIINQIDLDEVRYAVDHMFQEPEEEA